MHSNFLIVEILTIGFALASILAYIMSRLKLSPILGYMLAGYLIGPYSPGFVADTTTAEQLAELGVILMLFGVGMHFKVEDLMRVKNIALPGAIGQTLIATLMTIAIMYTLGWPIHVGVIMGLAIGVASTVVLVRMLTENAILATLKGHIAVGWLVVEDIFTVVILILLPTLASITKGNNFSLMNMAGEVSWVFAKFAILTLFMFTIGYKIAGYLLTKVARLRSQELFTLTIFALVLLIATGSTVIFGTSIALGSFIAGMVVGKTNVKHQAAANALPIKDIFSVIFFLTVGMLFNPAAIVSNFALFIGLIIVILLVKPLVAYVITLFSGYSLNTALTVAISLAQIGEFSFILAEEAMNLKLIPDEAFDILVACSMVSISINPLLFKAIDYIENSLKHTFFQKFKNRSFAKKVNQSSNPMAVIIGFGPIGKEVLKIVTDAGYMAIIIEQNIDTVSEEEKHHSIIFGEASEHSILKAAQIDKATHLVITIPDTHKVIKIIQTTRQLNPKIQIIARARYIDEKKSLEKLKVKYVCTEVEALNAFTSLTNQVFKL